MVKLVSSDLNGTLVHQHTMSDMIRKYIGEEEYQKANEVFKKQTAGEASMEEAFAIAGPLTRGLTLRQAVEYTQEHMKYVDGFHEFVDSLAESGTHFVINSTGYSATIQAIRAQIGSERIHGYVGNVLLFGLTGVKCELPDRLLETVVKVYFTDENAKSYDIYDEFQATGEVQLEIENEDAKAELLLEYVQENFPDLKPTDLIHMGDTMGDSGGIYGIAKAGGIGIAFNYNDALRRFLESRIEEEPELEDRIYFVDPKGEDADLRNVLKLLNL